MIRRYDDYDLEDRMELRRLLGEFAHSMKLQTPRETDIDNFVEAHNDSIYFFVVQDEIVGFTSYIIHSYYGFMESTLCQDFIYIEEAHRNKRLILDVAKHILGICDYNGIALEHNYGSEDSIRFLNRKVGKTINTTQVYDLETVRHQLNKMKRR